MESMPILITKGPKLLECSFRTKEEKSKDENKRTRVKCIYSIAISDDDNKDKIVVRVGVRSETRNIPFKFKIVLEAEFCATGDTRPDNHTISVSVLPYFLPTLQGYVADFTARAYLKPFYIGIPINFSPKDTD